MNTHQHKEIINKVENSSTNINAKYFKKELSSFQGYTKLNYKELYINREKIIAFSSQEQIDSEEWLPYKKVNGLYVSNLGRVKYNEQILKQVEEFENNETQTHIGYLQLSKIEIEELEKTNNIKIWNKISSNYIYQLVAEVWLATNHTEECDVHHITNDGYDNSINNLVLVKKCQHKYIHSKNEDYFPEKCKACEIIKYTLKKEYN